MPNTFFRPSPGGVIYAVDLLDHPIIANTTYYVSATGDDITGDGSVSTPWATVGRVMTEIRYRPIASNVYVTIQLLDGHYNFTSTIVAAHPNGDRIRIYGQTVTTKTSSGLTANDGATITMQMTGDVSDVSVNDYVTLTTDGDFATYNDRINGCFKVTNVDTVNDRLTVNCPTADAPDGVIRPTAPASFTTTVDVYKTVCNFSGMWVSGLLVMKENKLGSIDKLALVGPGIWFWSQGIHCFENSLVVIGSEWGANKLCLYGWNEGIRCELGSGVHGNYTVASKCNIGCVSIDNSFVYITSCNYSYNNYANYTARSSTSIGLNGRFMCNYWIGGFAIYDSYLETGGFKVKHNAAGMVAEHSSQITFTTGIENYNEAIYAEDGGWGLYANRMSYMWIGDSTTYNKIDPPINREGNKQSLIDDDQSPGPVDEIENLLYVAKNGSDTVGVGDGSMFYPFLTVKKALESITDNDSDHRYTIYAGPGSYTEDNPVVMKDYVNIVSMGDQTNNKIVAQNSGSDIIRPAHQAVLRGWELEGATTACAVHANSAINTYFENITVVDCLKGFKVSHASASIGLYNINGVTDSFTMTEFIEVTAGNVDVRNPFLLGSSIVTTFVKADGGSSIIHVYSPEAEDTTLTNGFYADNGGSISISGGIVDDTTNVFVVDNASTIEASGFIIHDNCTNHFVYNDNDSTITILGGDAERDKLVLPAALHQYGLQGYGYDAPAKRLRILSALSVGLPFQGRASYLGEGGPYTTDVRVISFDGGTTYTDVTDNAQIQFPNLLAGTILYFGNGYPFYGVSYLMGSQALTGGAYVWEYYDGGASAWVEMDTLNTLSNYSDSQNGLSFTGSNGKRYTVRCDQNVKTGVTENNGAATGHVATEIFTGDGQHMWVRCRITSNLTQTPYFSAVHLKGNYANFRADGTRSYNGEARVEVDVDIPLGLVNSGVVNKDLDVSTNITYPFLKNELAKIGADEALYFRLPILSEMDTSCGLSYCFEFCNTYIPTLGDETAQFTFRYAILSENAIYDGSESDVLLDSWDEVIAITDTIYASERHTVSKRIDVSDANVGDVLYVKLHRPNGVGDTYEGEIAVTGQSLTYRKWQDGLSLE